MSSRIWYRAVLSSEQLAAGHIDIIRRRFSEAVRDAGGPEGACLFVTSRNADAARPSQAAAGQTAMQGGAEVDTVFFSPLSISAVAGLISEYQAEPSEPPDRAGAALLVGDERDWDLLPRSSH